MFNSIKWRLTITYIILIVLSLSVTGLFLVEAMDRYFVSDTEETLTAHARVFTHYAELTFLGNDLAQKFGRDVDARVQILDERGIVVGDSLWPEVPIGEPLGGQEVERALRGQIVSRRDATSPEGERLLHVAAPLRTEDGIIGAVYLTTGLARIDNTLDIVRNFLFLGMSVALVVSMMVGFYLAGTVTGPIREITGAANQMAAGDFDLQIKPRGKDELAQLAKTFNYLTGRLKITISEISGERKKLTAVMTSMGDALLAVDSRGEGLLLNPAAESLFGVKTADVIGRPLREKLNNPRLWALFREVLEDAAPLIDEIEIGGDGEAIYKVQVSPIFEDNGEETGAVAVLRDITDLRRLERMRLQFLSNVSHELRTPLTSIKGFAVTLADEVPAETPARRYAEIIEQETDRLSRLVEDLLNLSSMDTLEITMERVSVNPGNLVQSCTEQLMPRAQRAGVFLQVLLEPDLPRILCDPDRIKQIIINLLDNAIKFTPRDGEITVKAWSDNEYFNVTVADTGIGIPDEEIPHIFDRFYRVNKQYSRAVGGTGLGLSIAKVLAEQHGGSITAVSKQGQGTKFHLRLPK